MAKLIFVNLPVADVAASVAFYEAIGATRNPAFSDDSAACMVFSDHIHFMLLGHDRFATFTTKTIVDARAQVETLTCLSEDSREAVDATMERALAAGGREDVAAAQDMGFMVSRRFEDPDGHSVDLVWMDVGAAADAMTPEHAAA